MSCIGDCFTDGFRDTVQMINDAADEFSEFCKNPVMDHQVAKGVIIGGGITTAAGVTSIAGGILCCFFCPPVGIALIAGGAGSGVGGLAAVTVAAITKGNDKVAKSMLDRQIQEINKNYPEVAEIRCIIEEELKEMKKMSPDQVNRIVPAIRKILQQNSGQFKLIETLANIYESLELSEKREKNLNDVIVNLKALNQENNKLIELLKNSKSYRR